ncbi:hypothetical protein ErPhphiEa104_gp039 [Erwinia phage phiEa104]|uniref:Uncharacterized protein n=8 Tax=Caudoviricetes TaxID=2731619 RepID=A0A6B9RN93_9CAUD|nr:hypothetical protein Ea21-4_gp39 [Erwinia phage phiEa21-4]YP_004327014.1 hypothetical protein ErPhphiEa104_gp039 [Erwinia phage phiEa104]AXN57360.1 hypothetical protein SUNLIREN_38 [Erwinia phage SunLIRen]AYD79601.1 hypothetical protein LINGLNFE_00119 [Enterobacter phage phi63_307]QEG07691.1 hypothetical protein [Salmonella phage SE5]QGF21889.1 hypothetical protein [Salmonella phage ST-3]QHI00584.1 hypothetical protein [Salmonella phage vB_SenM_SB18]UFD98433.1 hypothetical protein SPARTY_
MTVQRTFNTDESVTLSGTTALELIGEMYNQIGQGFKYVPNSFVAKTPFNPNFKVTVKQDAEELSSDVAVHRTDLKDGDSIIHSPNAESLLRTLSNALVKQQSGATIKSVTMTLGAYSATVSGLTDEVAEEIPATPDDSQDDIEPLFKTNDEEPVKTLEPFDMSIAMSKQSKEELVEYVEKYGISLDKRRNLAAMQNQLQTIVNEG